MSEVLIQRSGNMVAVTRDGYAPVDRAGLRMLQDALSYQHMRHLRGHEKYSIDGGVRHVELETRTLYEMQEAKFVTSVGCLRKVAHLLQQAGYTVRYFDMNPQKPAAIYTPRWDNLFQYMQLRPGQEACLQAIINNSCGVVDATMGFGKTAIFAMLCLLYPEARFDIMVRSRDIAAMIRTRLTKYIPNVGLVGNSKREYGDRVTVCTAGSAHHMTDRPQTDFFLADEVHQLVTPSVSRWIIRNWPQARCFGFTGTYEKRGDQADAQLELLFGPLLYQMPYQDAERLGLVVPINVRWLPIRMSNSPAAGCDDVGRKRWGIWRNDVRNAAIAADVRQNYPDNTQQILILVETLEHAVMLWQHLPEFSLCYADISKDRINEYRQSGLLPEGFVPTTPDVRRQMQLAFEDGSLKRVIATDVWATGVDFQALSVLYRGDGRSSKIIDLQGPGRVSRVSEGKEGGEVVDCIDIFDASLLRKSKSRKRSYGEMGWTQNWPRHLED